MIHRHESGQIAWATTLRYVVALVWPLWDDARGRAYTAREQAVVLARRPWIRVTAE